ncbi:transglutaminase N-terminal domain-containing protein, partial [Mycolicibacterium mucogenicum]|uniref:transglutaminase N-terminal domain-containing protein n=1 Tax=Mycolicibacterium mucogenicum TaxID=56689 RepID=UPI000A782FF7
MTREYQITHRTRYRYSDVVTSSYGRGFLTPRDSGQQRCQSYRLNIDPEPADRSTSRDAYGNISSYFHVTQPHRELVVTGRSIVEVDPPPAEWYGAGAALAPWEQSRPAGHETRCGVIPHLVGDLRGSQIQHEFGGQRTVRPGRP